MKLLSIFLLIVGLTSLVFIIAYPMLWFDPFSASSLTDKQYIMILFGALVMCMAGFTIQYFIYKPVSYYDYKRNQAARRYALYAFTLCLCLMIATLVFFIY